MESRKSRSSATNFQDKFYGDHTYKKEERREGRSKIRRSDSSHSRREASRSREKSQDFRTNPRRTASVKKVSREPERVPKENRELPRNPDGWQKGSSSTTERRNHRWADAEVPNWKTTPDKRRWGWAGNEFDFSGRNNPARTHRPYADMDYVEMSSMDTTSSSTSEECSSVAYPHERLQKTNNSSKPYNYNKLYTPNHRSVSRSRSINRPSPPRAKSLGPTSQPYSIYPSRTQSFTSLYDTRYGVARGTSLDLRPLRSSVSSQGIFFTETGHVPRNTGYDQEGHVSLSLQDIQMMGQTGRNAQQKIGRSLLDLSNVTINDSEIDKVRGVV